MKKVWQQNVDIVAPLRMALVVAVLTVSTKNRCITYLPQVTIHETVNQNKYLCFDNRIFIPYHDEKALHVA